MYIVTDKPLAWTSGGLLQQGQCCMPWQVAVLPIQRDEYIASVPSVHCVIAMYAAFLHYICICDNHLLELALHRLCKNQLCGTSCSGLQCIQLQPVAYMNMVH